MPLPRLRGNTGLLVLCHGIRDWDRRVHMSAATWKREHAASRRGGCDCIRIHLRLSTGVNEMRPSMGRRWVMCSVREGRAYDAIVSYGIRNENCFKKRRTVRKSGTHLLFIVAVLDSAMDIEIELLTTPIPRARATQVCTTCLEQLEEPPLGCPEVQVAIILDSRTEVEFAHGSLEVGSWRQRWEQAKSARRRCRRWRDGSCAGNLRRHMQFFVKYMDQKSEARAKKGEE